MDIPSQDGRNTIGQPERIARRVDFAQPRGWSIVAFGTTHVACKTWRSFNVRAFHEGRELRVSMVRPEREVAPEQEEQRVVLSNRLA